MAKSEGTNEWEVAARYPSGASAAYETRVRAEFGAAYTKARSTSASRGLLDGVRRLYEKPRSRRRTWK